MSVFVLCLKKIKSDFEASFWKRLRKEIEGNFKYLREQLQYLYPTCSYICCQSLSFLVYYSCHSDHPTYCCSKSNSLYSFSSHLFSLSLFLWLFQCFPFFFFGLLSISAKAIKIFTISFHCIQFLWVLGRKSKVFFWVPKFS